MNVAVIEAIPVSLRVVGNRIDRQYRGFGQLGVAAERFSGLADIVCDFERQGRQRIDIGFNLLIEDLLFFGQFGDHGQLGVWRPRLDGRAAQGAADQTDRNSRLLMHFAAKIIPDRREILDRLGRAGSPWHTIEHGAWSGLCRATHLIQAYHRDIRLCEVVRPVACTQHPFHVRLAAANPDITHEDIIQRELVLARDGHDRGGCRDLHRVELDAPIAILVGHHRFLLAGKCNGHLLTGLCRAINRHRHIPL